MRISRKCPRCAEDVKVTKTMTPVVEPDRVEKLQTVKCSGCGLTGHVTVKSCTFWNFPPLAINNQ